MTRKYSLHTRPETSEISGMNDEEAVIACWHCGDTILACRSHGEIPPFNTADIDAIPCRCTTGETT